MCCVTVYDDYHLDQLKDLSITRGVPSIIADYNKTIVAFGVVSFQSRRSLVIALSLQIARWPLKMSHWAIIRY